MSVKFEKKSAKKSFLFQYDDDSLYKSEVPGASGSVASVTGVSGVTWSEVTSVSDTDKIKQFKRELIDSQ